MACAVLPGHCLLEHPHRPVSASCAWRRGKGTGSEVEGPRHASLHSEPHHAVHDHAEPTMQLICDATASSLP